jgi:DeoR family transcriptional regulator, ulaG and ulaABCDEF operon transcriptional repressor
MHESERHRIILSVVGSKPVATVAELVELTESSEATIRRDIAALHVAKRLRRVRGGAEALHPAELTGLAGRPFALNMARNIAQKRAIAKAAVELVEDGDAIIVNGGTTTFQMVHPLANRRVQVFTNSFAIAEHLLRETKNTVMLCGGTVYREQAIILSPFDDDLTRHFSARLMFMGAQGVGPLGVGEVDALVIRAEEKLIGQAEELVVLVDSSKFRRRTAMIVRPLSAVATVVTDDGIVDADAKMLEDAGVRLVVAPVRAAELRDAG